MTVKRQAGAGHEGLRVTSRSLDPGVTEGWHTLPPRTPATVGSLVKHLGLVSISRVFPVLK